MDSKKVYWLLLAVFGGVFYVMNYFTPMSGDDYVYCFFFENTDSLVRPTSERVASFGTLLESMWNHYLVVNGRFVTHVIVQDFCALWGKILFNIANALVFMAFLHVLVLLSRHKYSIFVLAVVYLVSMCILPYPGQTMLWMTGSINYLWPTTAALWYIYWLQNYVPQKESWWKYVIVGIIGIIIAWTNECISAPVALGVFLYMIPNIREFRGLNISAFIGYAVGATLVVFSPGTFVRIENDPTAFQPLGIDQFLFIHSYNMLNNFVHTIFPLIVLIVFVYKFVKGYIKHPLKIFGSLYGSIFFSFVLFLWALGMIDSRIFFGVAVFSFVTVVSWMDSFIQKLKVSRCVVLIVYLLCVVPSYCAISATYKYYLADKEATELVLSSPSKCIIPMQKVPEYSRYCFYGGMESLTPCRYMHSKYKALYWGKEYIQALPEDVYVAWKNGELLSLKTTNILKLPKEQVVHSQAFAIYKYSTDMNELLPRQRLIRGLFNTLNYEIRERVYFIEKEDSCYYMFPKANGALSIELPMIVEGQETLVQYKP